MAAKAPWKPILEATLNENLKRNRQAAYFQFSTFNTTTQRPANRTVVFRGFAGEKNTSHNIKSPIVSEPLESTLLVFSTNIRSQKVQQLYKNPGFEIAWWFNGTEDQFRLSGDAFVLPHPKHARRSQFPDVKLANQFFSPSNPKFDWEAERLQVWFRMSDVLRASFLTGMLAEHGNYPEKLPPIGENEEQEENIKAALENFALVVLKVDFVDYFRLNPSSHTTWTYDDTINSWQIKKV
ncbi:hypothetical protein G9A89_023240 [Geosiphon pyriformis]|nr:hypothetical protein G9A89_023240 [Geosiphon pyriformis]